MELLKQKILANARVLEGDVLKVDHFLSQQIDIELLSEIACEFHRIFAGEGITKVLTLESSGIAVAALTAAQFRVPLVYAKRVKRGSATELMYAAPIESAATAAQPIDAVLPQEYITAEDCVLVIDDFLAQGSILFALFDLLAAAGATVGGCGVIIEKMRGGGDRIRERGIRLKALAKITTISATDGIQFAE